MTSQGRSTRVAGASVLEFGAIAGIQRLEASFLIHAAVPSGILEKVIVKRKSDQKIIIYYDAYFIPQLIPGLPAASWLPRREKVRLITSQVID